MKTNNHVKTRNVAGVLILAPYDSGLAIDGDESSNGLMAAIVRSEGEDGKWTLPKGAISTGESFEDAAIREVKEETGISLGKNALILDSKNGYKRIGKTATHYIEYCLALVEDPVELKPAEHDVSEAVWVSLDGLVKMLSHTEAQEAVSEHLQSYGLTVEKPKINSTIPVHTNTKHHSKKHK